MDALISNSSLPPVASITPSSSIPFGLFHCSSPTIFIRKTTTILRFRNNSSALPLFTVNCGAGIVEINESQFKDTVLNANRPILVEFVANWCGPCRLISPAIQSLAQEYEDRLTVVKIDHDANPRLIKEYKVYGLPTLVLFKNGQEVPERKQKGSFRHKSRREASDIKASTQNPFKNITPHL